MFASKWWLMGFCFFLFFSIKIGQTYITLFRCMVVFHSLSSVWHGAPLSCLHTKRNLENRKTLTSIQIMNSVSLSSTTIVNSVGIFNDNVVMNSNFREQYWVAKCFLWILLGWTLIYMDNVGSITLPQFFSSTWMYE